MPKQLRHIVHGESTERGEPAAPPAHLAHPAEAIAHTAPEHIAEYGADEQQTPDGGPFGDLVPSSAAVCMRGEIQRHNDRKTVQSEIANHTQYGSKRNLVVVFENGHAAREFTKLIRRAHRVKIGVTGFRHKTQTDNHADNRERQ